MLTKKVGYFEKVAQDRSAKKDLRLASSGSSGMIGSAASAIGAAAQSEATEVVTSGIAHQQAQSSAAIASHVGKVAHGRSEEGSASFHDKFLSFCDH